jgi:hypothetical protein
METDSNQAQSSTTSTEAAPPAPPVVITTQADARARLLRTKQPKFELAVVEGAEYALVVPPEGVRGEIGAQALDVDGKGRVRNGNPKRRQAMTIIAMVHAIVVDPTTQQKRPGAKVFSDADLQTLMNEPSCPESVICLFGEKCEDVLYRADENAMVAAKNG